MSRPSFPNMLTLLILLCLAIFPAQQALAQSGFAGEWRTTLGPTQLTVNGATVVGTYHAGDADGEIRGRLSEDATLLTGSWVLGNARGHFVLRCWKDAEAFAGRWWDDQEQREGEWIGVRPEKQLAALSITPEQFAGDWQSNYGMMSLNVQGEKVTGIFDGSRNDGHIDGQIIPSDNKLIANWKDKRYSGRMIVRLRKSGKAFLGEWWYSDNQYGGFWYGVRPLETRGCISGDCSEGRGIFIWPDGSRYSGAWKRGVYDGIGAYYDGEGRLINRGLWLEGIFQGTCLSGDCQQGAGKLRNFNGDIYEGTFVEGLPEGEVHVSYRNGDQFQGSMRRGLLHGDGTYRWAAGGAEYAGRFSRGQMLGRGKINFGDGRQYEGTFSRGMRQGNGTMTWSNGDRYEGAWRGDQMSGEGSYTFSNGDVYQGSMNANRPEGRGLYTGTAGQHFEGEWEAGIPSAAQGGAILENPTAIATCQDPGGMPQALSDEAFIIYRVNESTTAGLGDSPADKEVMLKYFIVEAAAETAPEALKEFLSARTGVSDWSEFEIERSEQPTTRLRQLLERYRFTVVPTRINTIFGGYLTME